MLPASQNVLGSTKKGKNKKIENKVIGIYGGNPKW
jgi:hypothetical protein